ncbi:MAG: hypothetical protein ACJ790_07665 [Myxococcaceae bacterium]
MKSRTRCFTPQLSTTRERRPRWERRATGNIGLIDLWGAPVHF